jgi:histidinol-phosphate aminotransferase
VLRTFSKAMAMGGLRVGYMLAAPEIAVEVNKAKLPYNLNVFSMAAAEAAIDHYEELLRPIVDLLVLERERVIAAVAEIEGLEPYPSQANFFVVRTKRLAPRELFERLVARGILVRDVSHYPMLSDALRISVGTPAENDALLEALREAAADC